MKSVHVWLLASSLLALVGALRPASASESSEEKLRQLMLQQRQSAGISATSGPSAERLQERTLLLEKGESALARLEVDTALQAFERAALILHAADTEIALVRAYMQGGEYRRALAFGAHTAGAHLDAVGGAALYAWLLHIGGQPAIAQRLLNEAESRSPGKPLIKTVQQQLASGLPRASHTTPALLTLPTRLAPYGSGAALPAAARVLGNGVLLLDGKRALVPAALLPRTGKVWLRNGLGQLSEAQLAMRLPESGVALLELRTLLPTADGMTVYTGNSFPGSVGFAVEFVPGTDALPAWPVLHSGFLGGVSIDGLERQLGIDLAAGKRGGPVFDSGGRLIGLALQGKNMRGDTFMPMSRLNEEMRKLKVKNPAPLLASTEAQTSAEPRSPVDLIYESSLKTSLQVIGVP